MEKLEGSSTEKFDSSDFTIALRAVVNKQVVQKLRKKSPVMLVQAKIMLEHPDMEFGNDDNHFQAVSVKVSAEERERAESVADASAAESVSSSAGDGEASDANKKKKSKSAKEDKRSEPDVESKDEAAPDDQKPAEVEPEEKKDVVASTQEEESSSSESSSDSEIDLGDFEEEWWPTQESVEKKFGGSKPKLSDPKVLRKMLLGYEEALVELRAASSASRKMETKMRTLGASTVANFRSWQADQQEEKENLENLLESLERDTDEQARENQEREDGVNLAERDLEKSKAKLANFQKESQDAVDAKAEYVENLGLLFKELEHLEARNAELREELDLAQKDFEDTERDHAETREMLEVVMEELDDVEVQVETTEMTKKSLENQLRRLKRGTLLFGSEEPVLPPTPTLSFRLTHFYSQVLGPSRAPLERVLARAARA
jgi:hypothetical protein